MVSASVGLLTIIISVLSLKISKQLEYVASHFLFLMMSECEMCAVE